MVAYSFKKQFVPLIESGKKRQTIRGNRLRHARPGEAIQLYYAMRTKHCRKIIADPVCLQVYPIEISITPEAGVDSIVFDGHSLDLRSMDVLARHDGFENLAGMGKFWFDTHGACEFEGVLILWGDA